jgi:hypothetical protein
MNISDALRFGIEGEFTQVSPSKLASPTSQNPIARAHFALIKELARMHVPSLSVSPTPEEFDDVADYLRRVTDLFDVSWLQPIGQEVQSNALCSINTQMFCGQFVGAIDGNATHEIQAAREAAAEGQDEDADADYRWDEQRDDLSHS